MAKSFATEPDTELRLCQRNCHSYADAGLWTQRRNDATTRRRDDATPRRRDAATPQRRNDDAMTQRRNAATPQRRNDTTTQRCHNATTQRRNDATTQRRNDATVQSAFVKIKHNAYANCWSSTPSSFCAMYAETAWSRLSKG